jgi:iron(III) transport system substrate-binding protein
MIRQRTAARAVAVVLAASLLLPDPGAARAEEINLYSTREAPLVEPVIAAFTAATGIKVNLTVIADNLVKRMQAEGDSSPADVLMTIGIDKTSQLADAGLTQAITSSVLDRAIGAPLRDRGRQWVGLSVRPRVVVTSSDAALEAIRYEDLALPKWRGKLCMRSMLHQNNVALVAAYLLHNGEAATAAWLHGLRTNLAQPPDGKDNDVIRNIAQGACAIGIANTVALAQLRDGREGREWTGYANQVKAVPTAFGNGGAHVNITGAALAKHAPHRDAAVKFLEYLVTPAAQKLYAAAELEYPVAADAEAAPLVTAIGSFAADTLPLDEIAAHQKAAVALIRQAGFEK